MPFLYAAEYLLVSVLILGAFTQLVIPILRGTKVFPLFRQEGKIERQIAAAKQSKIEEQLKQELTDLSQKDPIG